MGAVWRGPGLCPPMAPGSQKGSCWCPQARHPHASGKGKGWGWQWEKCSPGDVYKQLHWLPAGVPVPCKRLPLVTSYLNISVTSPLASATRTGKPMQAGTRYRRAGCKRTQGSEAMLGQTPARAMPIIPPFPGHDRDSYFPGSQSESVAGPGSGAPDSQTRAVPP